MNNISLVIIGRNEGKNLKRTLSSIKTNQFKNIIYVDSSSIDNSIEIAKNSKKTSKIIKVLSNKYSAALARNVGLKYVNTELVQFLDGDQTLSDKWIKKASNFLNLNQNTAIVHGYKYEFNDKENLNKFTIRRDNKNWQADYLQGSFLAKTEVLKKVNFMDIRFKVGEERDLYVRIHNKGYKVWYLDEFMSSHYNFKPRGLKYILFSGLFIYYLFPLIKYIFSKKIFSFIFVHRFLLPQLIIEVFSITALIISIKNIPTILVIQLLSLIIYKVNRRKGQWLIWKAVIINFFRIPSLYRPEVIYSHYEI